MLFLEVSTLQWPELHLDVSELQRIVLLLEVSATGPELNLDVSALRRYVSNPQGPVHTYCSAQTRTGIGHLRKPPGVELIPCRRKPLRRTRLPTRPGANASMKRTSVVGHNLYFARLSIVG